MNNLILLAYICASFAAAIHMQTMIMLSWGAGKGSSRVSSMDGDALLRIRILVSLIICFIIRHLW